jgi:hemerythrin-like metal-binding protein
MGGLGEKETAVALMELHWRRSYETGHPIIDQQHRALFDIGNKLIHAAHSGKHRIEIELLLDAFVAHVKEHFATEEEVLCRTGFPLSARHKELHRALLERARELRKWYGAGRLAASELVGFIADDVIADHILKEDSKFALNDR